VSNRVRCLLCHPDHGPMMNGNAMKFVESTFSERQSGRVRKHVLPTGVNLWPRWKRCSWMAKQLGPTWKLQVFREPRCVRAVNSLFWKAAVNLGFSIPKRKKLKVKQVLPGGRILNPGVAANIRYIDDLIVNADPLDVRDGAIPAGGLRQAAAGNQVNWNFQWNNEAQVPIQAFPVINRPVAEVPAPGRFAPRARRER
jgi:hypothetical protein